MNEVIDRNSAAKIDIDTSMYDFRYDKKDFYRNDPGLTEEIVLKLSKDKNDPKWIRDFRLASLKIYDEMPVPSWGPDISGLHIE